MRVNLSEVAQQAIDQMTDPVEGAMKANVTIAICEYLRHLPKDVEIIISDFDDKKFFRAAAEKAKVLSKAMRA